MKHFRYAHRGLHDAALGVPENSLAAFRRAAEHGFGSELDVHLLADGALAVLHDSALRRMTGRDGVVEDLTAPQLREYALGGTAETIPQFSEVLDVYEGTGLPLCVELKSFRDDYDALTARAVEELDRHGVPFVMESFDPHCLLWLKLNRPEITRGQLAQDFLRPGWSSGLGAEMDRRLTDMAFNAETQPHFVSYQYDHRDADALRRVKETGVEIFYWTIRSREDLARAEAEGAQAIFEGFVP